MYLARLRSGVALDRVDAPVASAVRAEDRGGDGSVQVHACHGLVRQLEVLRDALLHALEDDHELEPRDVLVLCPDLRRVAPLVGPFLGADVAGMALPFFRAADASPDGAVAFGRRIVEEIRVATLCSGAASARGLRDVLLEPR